MNTPPRAAGSVYLGRLGAAHDFVTRVSFGAAALCVAVIAISFCYEVVSRYFFDAPTEWATPFVTYSLCAMIFLAMPELTRQGEHIAINVVLDRVTGARARVLNAAIRAVSAVTCVVAVWFCADATLDQFQQEVWTNPPYAVLKWTLSVLIPYGMLSSAIYFLRQLVSGEAPKPSRELSP